MTIRNVAILCAATLALTGCATDPRLKSDCDWTEPIRPSRQDVLTRQTKEQILAHNTTGAKICGWRP